MVVAIIPVFSLVVVAQVVVLAVVAMIFSQVTPVHDVLMVAIPIVIIVMVVIVHSHAFTS